jgi:hypothetical protein
MLFGLGYLISLITFPGIVIHEIAHRFFCDLTGTPVYEVRYFKAFGNPAGYVIHGEPDSLGASFAISMGPLLINTLLCIIFCFPYTINSNLGGTDQSAFMVLYWVGISAGMHAFPSNQDAKSFSEHVKRNHSVWLYLSVLPLRVLIFIANLLSIFWLDIVYAVLVANSLPSLINWMV